MEPRLAFTAEYWNESAVVCRALENSAGPIVDQQFGLFATWTQAHDFARKLNEGLEIDSSEAGEIVTSAKVVTQAILAAAAPQRPQGKRAFFPEAAGHIIVQFIVAELRLAFTFCHLIRAESTPNAFRMTRNAHNALLNGLHFAAHYELNACDLQTIATNLEALQSALRDVPLHRDHQLDESCASGV